MSVISSQIDELTEQLSQTRSLVEMQRQVQIKIAADKQALIATVAELRQEIEELHANTNTDSTGIETSMIALRAVIAAIKAIVDAPVANPAEQPVRS